MELSSLHDSIRERHELPASEPNQATSSRWGLGAALLTLLLITAWSYWPIMQGLFSNWQRDDNYSAGQLVPLIAVIFIWRDWGVLRRLPLVPCWGAGIALLLLVETAGIYFYLVGSHPSLERYLLVLQVGGLVLLVAGWEVFRRVLLILLFLLLMVPFPGRVHDAISSPLQNLATTGSVFLLEASGIRVSQEGNVVVLNESTPIAVAEACSGLRMLTAFIMVAAFVAYMVKRPPSHKVILLLSSIPVAVIGNIVRIFLTAMLMVYVNTVVAEMFFHDLAGLVMMPVAVALLFGELWLVDRIIVSEGSGEKGGDTARPTDNRTVVLRGRRQEGKDGTMPSNALSDR
jgi:exosortase